MSGALLLTAALWLVAPTTVSADDPFAFCEQKIEASPDDWQGYNCVYRLARTEGLYDEAIALLEAQVDANPERVWAKSYLAAHYADNDDPRARGLWEDTLEALIAKGDAKEEIYTRLSLADFLARSDFAAAKLQLGAASKTAEALGDPAMEALVDVELARQMLREDADLVEALRLAERGWERLADTKAYQPRLTALHVRAGIVHAMGMFSRAAEIRQQQLELAQSYSDPLAEVSALLNLAALAANNPSLAGLESPVELARKALSLAKAHALVSLEAQTHCMLGDLRDGDPRAHYERCRELLGTDLVFLDRAEQGLAMLEAFSDPELAFEHADEAVRVGRQRGKGAVEAQRTRAVLRWRHGPRALAVADSIRLLDELDDAIARQRNPIGRARYLAMAAPVFYFTAERVASPVGRPPKAPDIELGLRIIERMRTRVLVEQLDQAEALGPPSRDDPLWSAHEQSTRRLAQIQKRLISGDLDEDEQAIELDVLRRTEEETSALWDAIIDADPRLSNIRHAPALTLADIQSTLEPGQALLSFQLSPALVMPQPGPEQVPSWLAVVTRDGARTYPLPPRDELEDIVTLFAGLFEARNGSEAITAVGLYERLVGQALADLPPDVDNLVLVPDGALHSLPFAALRPDVAVPPLAARFALTTVPSISLWLRMKAIARRPADPGVVLADPPALEVAALGMTDPLGPLPLARREAEAFVEHLGPETVARVGGGASEAFVKAGGLEEHAVVHFGAHALLDEAHPHRTAIVLASGEADEDGLLQMREITRANVHGALVVLAGCRSASGAVIGGEGPVGLSRAFFLAGARTVVASQWRIRDDDAAAFFEAFYRRLGEGRSVVDAVRAAQSDRRAAGAPAVAWAGYVVLGDGDFVPAPERRDVFWWPMLLFPFLFAGLGILLTARDRR